MVGFWAQQTTIWGKMTISIGCFSFFWLLIYSPHFIFDCLNDKGTILKKYKSHWKENSLTERGLCVMATTAAKTIWYATIQIGNSALLVSQHFVHDKISIRLKKVIYWWILCLPLLQPYILNIIFEAFFHRTYKLSKGFCTTLDVIVL